MFIILPSICFLFSLSIRSLRPFVLVFPWPQASQPVFHPPCRQNPPTPVSSHLLRRRRPQPLPKARNAWMPLGEKERKRGGAFSWCSPHRSVVVLPSSDFHPHPPPAKLMDCPDTRNNHQIGQTFTVRPCSRRDKTSRSSVYPRISLSYSQPVVFSVCCLANLIMPL
jgi:hypothetical protein